MAPSVSVLVPVYNEEETLEKVLSDILGLADVDRCIVVDDSSVDKSPKILKDFLDKKGGKLRVVTHPENRGKGAALRSGIAMADTDFIVVQDADSEYQISDLAKVVKMLKDGKAEVLFGSRFLQRNPNIYRTYLWGNKLLTFFINLLGHGCLTDSYTGCKAMPTKKWRALDLKSHGFEIEAEISVKILMAGWNVQEIPVSYAPRTFAQGKKIRGSDAVKGALKALSCWIYRSYPKN